MSKNKLYQYFPLKIRTIRDQRFLITWAVVSFVVSVILTGAVAAFEYQRMVFENYILPDDNAGGTPGIGEAPAPAKFPPWVVFGTDKLTFILLGYDEVDEFAHRSDTLMVGAVDFYARKIRVVSIPRDTLIHIPRYSFMKVNSAYALGGDDLVRRTMESFIGVDIDYVISVNYRGFVEVVDALGGVDMTVERAMNYDDRRGDTHIHIEAGDNHFDGETALDFARFRHDASGDFGRIERQQALLKALFDQAIKPANWLKLSNVANVIASNIVVSVNEDSPRNPPEVEISHILSLIGFLRQVRDEDISFYLIPTEDIMYDHLACLRPIYSRTRQVLDEVFNDEDPIAWRIESEPPSVSALDMPAELQNGTGSD